MNVFPLSVTCQKITAEEYYHL